MPALARWAKRFWLDMEYKINVGEQVVDLMKLSDAEFKQFMLWRLGISGSIVVDAPPSKAPDSSGKMKFRKPNAFLEARQREKELSRAEPAAVNAGG